MSIRSRCVRKDSTHRERIDMALEDIAAEVRALD